MREPGQAAVKCTVTETPPETPPAVLIDLEKAPTPQTGKLHTGTVIVDGTQFQYNAMRPGRWNYQCWEDKCRQSVNRGGFFDRMKRTLFDNLLKLRDEAMRCLLHLIQSKRTTYRMGICEVSKPCRKMTEKRGGQFLLHLRTMLIAIMLQSVYRLIVMKRDVCLRLIFGKLTFLQ